MGYGRALLQRDVKQEEADLQKRAKKKSLWGSIGRTIGGLGAMTITGGVVNPLTVGLISGGASFLGGAIGAKASGTGDLSKGKFFKSDRESIQKELGAFGTANLMSALTSGLTAGVGQKLKLMKSGQEAAKLSEGFGMDFKGSMLGKELEKRAIGKELMKAGEASIGTADRTLQVGEGQFITGGDRGGMVLPDGTSIGSGRTSIPRGQMPEGGIDRLRSAMKDVAKPEVGYDFPLDSAESFDMPWEMGRDIEQFSEFGKYGSMEESLQQQEMLSNWQSPPQRFSESLQDSLGVRNRLGLGAANIYKNKMLKWGK